MKSATGEIPLRDFYYRVNFGNFPVKQKTATDNICSHSLIMPVTGVEPVRVLLPTGF